MSFPRLALHWPSIQTCILIRKFVFSRMCTISGSVFRSLVATGSTPTLIEQCRFLEAPLGTNITEEILKNPESLPSNRAIRDNLVKADIEACKDAANRTRLSEYCTKCTSMNTCFTVYPKMVMSQNLGHFN